jgi:hypothetical protein
MIWMGTPVALRLFLVVFLFNLFYGLWRSRYRCW